MERSIGARTSASAVLPVAARAALGGQGARRVPVASAEHGASAALVDDRSTHLSADPLDVGELRISARIVLYLARQPRFDPSESFPEALTQAGIARSLDASQASVAHALRRLTDGGLLEAGAGRVTGRRQRVKVYQITDEGRRLAEHIRRGMAGSQGLRTAGSLEP